MDLQLLLLFYLHFNQFHATRACFDIKLFQHSFSKCKDKTTSGSDLKFNLKHNQNNIVKLPELLDSIHCLVMLELEQNDKILPMNI